MIYISDSQPFCSCKPPYVLHNDHLGFWLEKSKNFLFYLVLTADFCIKFYEMLYIYLTTITFPMSITKQNKNYSDNNQCCIKITIFF